MDRSNYNDVEALGILLSVDNKMYEVHHQSKARALIRKKRGGDIEVPGIQRIFLA